LWARSSRAVNGSNRLRARVKSRFGRQWYRNPRYCTRTTKAVVISHHGVYRYPPVIGHHRLYRSRPLVITRFTGTAGCCPVIAAVAPHVDTNFWRSSRALPASPSCHHGAYRPPRLSSVIRGSTRVGTGACHHFRQLPLQFWSCEYSKLMR